MITRLFGTLFITQVMLNCNQSNFVTIINDKNNFVIFDSLFMAKNVNKF